jgi:hypothetical protein
MIGSVCMKKDKIQKPVTDEETKKEKKIPDEKLKKNIQEKFEVGESTHILVE